MHLAWWSVRHRWDHASWYFHASPRGKVPAGRGSAVMLVPWRVTFYQSPWQEVHSTTRPLLSEDLSTTGSQKVWNLPASHRPFDKRIPSRSLNPNHCHDEIQADSSFSLHCAPPVSAQSSSSHALSSANVATELFPPRASTRSWCATRLKNELDHEGLGGEVFYHMIRDHIWVCMYIYIYIY